MMLRSSWLGDLEVLEVESGAHLYGPWQEFLGPFSFHKRHLLFVVTAARQGLLPTSFWEICCPVLTTLFAAFLVTVFL